MICKNCGHECFEGKFCSECGNPLEEEKQDEKKASLPSIEELRATVIDIENEARSNITTFKEENDIFYIGRAEYDDGVEKMGGFKKKSHVPFFLFFVSISLALASFFSFLYLFSDTSGTLNVISMISAYLNIPAIIFALVSFALASHWFLAAREYKFLKKPPFITWTFVLSIFGVVFTSVCFCITTLPIMLF